MKAFVIPVIMAVAGLGIGGAAGHFLRPAPEAAAPPAEGTAETSAPAEDPAIPPEYVKLANQFIVPVLDEGRVASMVILSLGLEVDAGLTETVHTHEPKLRDEFLQVLFAHANTGGFRGSFTDASNLAPLRKALREAAQSVLPEGVRDVLISDIARQDG